MVKYYMAVESNLKPCSICQGPCLGCLYCNLYRLLQGDCKGLQERLLKGPLGLEGGFMRLDKGYIRVL